MDTKSLAKSKRVHSQRHSKKHHPNQSSNGTSASSTAASSTKRTPVKEIREKPRQSQGSSALPSNWDRYDKEYVLETENPSQDRISQPTEVVVPKSKGADYAHLISEAKSQFQTISSSEIFPSFDDVADFDQGIGSFLSVRGQSILSWIEGDNFVVEDKATASHEASILSLDLHTLAEQLAKVDLSKRLFIEADLLPPELFGGEVQASHNSGQEQATCGNEAAKKDLDELPSCGSSDGGMHANQYSEVTSSDTTSSNHSIRGICIEGSKSMDQFNDELQQFSRSDQSTVLESEVGLNVNSVTKQNKKLSRFEAAAAEAELDMLLGSISETNFLDSPGHTQKSMYTSHTSQGETSNSLLIGSSSDQSIPALPVKKGPDLHRSQLADDNLDDLLKETSSLINQNDAPLPHEVWTSPLDFISSPASPPASKSKLLDDFDSWLDTI